MTETLRRMKFTEADEALSDSRSQLALDAQKNLGYSKLAQAISAPDALLFGLRKLGIEPLVTSSVHAYMNKKVGHPSMRSGRKTGLIGIIVCALFALLACPTFVMMANSGDNRVTTWMNILGVTGCTLAGIAVLVFGGISITMIIENEGTRTTRSWKSVPLDGYEGNVPEFVIYRALRIKEAMPNAELSIMQLQYERDTFTRPDPDPFLAVYLKHERYFVDVWDEKEYESKL